MNLIDLEDGQESGSTMTTYMDGRTDRLLHADGRTKKR